MHTAVTTIAAIVALGFVGCSNAPEWEAPYRAALEAEWDEISPAETLQACTLFKSMTDDELRAVLATGAGTDDSMFDRIARDVGIEPTVADYQAAMDVAVSLVNKRCA